jgi:hypothetical protein
VAGAILMATVSFYDLASRGVAHKFSRLIVLAKLCIFWLLFNRIVTIYLTNLLDHKSFSEVGLFLPLLVLLLLLLRSPSNKERTERLS